MAGHDLMFAELKAHLVPLLARITKATAARDVPTTGRHAFQWPIKRFCERVSRAMGFDFEAGRTGIARSSLRWTSPGHAVHHAV